jgi:hypothetical protein
MNDYRRGFNDALTLMIDQMQYYSDEMRAKGAIELGQNTNPFDVAVNVAKRYRSERVVEDAKDYRHYRNVLRSYYDRQRANGFQE